MVGNEDVAMEDEELKQLFADENDVTRDSDTESRCPRDSEDELVTKEVPTETSTSSERPAEGTGDEFKCSPCGQSEDPPQDGEVRRPRLPADPGRPTQREVDEHEVCHIPFRSWCPYCIKGKAVSSPHKGSAYREEGLKITGVPTISLDYCWADGEDDEAERKESSPVLIIYIDLIDSLYAIPVKKKGVIPWVIMYITKKLETLGYGGTKITLKSDGEASIKAVVEAIAVARKAETAIIQAPRRESKCNGAVERAVRTWRSQLITMKCHIEAMIKEELDHRAPLVEWMVMWAAEVKNYFHVHLNGRTSYEMVTAHRFLAITAIFGEKVMFMVTPKKHGKNKWKEDWFEGAFLGVQGRTAEVILGNEKGIFRARSIRRLPRDDRWSAELLSKLQVGVAEHVTGEVRGPAEAITVKVDGPVAPPPEAREVVPRGLRLNKPDFLEHGYTGGCPGCMHQQTGLGTRVGHTPACRRRMEESLMQTPQGKSRVEANRNKLDEHAAQIGEEILRADQDKESKASDSKGGLGEESATSKGAPIDQRDEEPQDVVVENLEDQPHARSEARGDDQDVDVDVEDYEPTEPGDVLPDEMLARETVRPSDVRVEIPRRPAVKRDRSQDAAPDDVYHRHGRIGYLGKLETPMTIMSIGVKQKGEGKVDVMEVFSPERVGKVAEYHGLVQGAAFDLQNGWDLNDETQRQKMEKILDEQKPTLLIGSPPCVKFSILMNLLMGKNLAPERRARFHEELDEAISQLRFCFKLYRKQIAAGRYFLHEHPASASSWELHEVQELMQDPNVFQVVAHMCALGMTTKMPSDPQKEVPVLKPTRFLTNSWTVLEALDRRCECKDKHGSLLCGRAKAAQCYPEKMCHIICEAVAEQVSHDRWSTVKTRPMESMEVINFINSLQPGAVTTVRQHYRGTPDHWRDIFHEQDGWSRRQEEHQEGPRILRQELQSLYETDQGTRAWDDPNKCELDPQKVKVARATELEFFHKRGVYVKVKRSKVTGKIIKLKWIDTNKGDNDHPNYRSRLVGMEFSSGADPENFASTPPIEGLRVVVSHAATRSRRSRRRHKFMINDIARAYFNAKIDRDLYVELPPEDRVEGEDMVGKLELCLYGIQDAARCWQDLLAAHLSEVGFKRGVGHPCVFHHEDWDVKTVVHGDDYASSGPADGLAKLRQALEDKFDIRDTFILGYEDGDLREGKVLNRIVRAGDAGWELEADPRHAELLIQQMEMETSKGVVTPGVDQDDAEAGEDEELSDKGEIKKFRGVAARANYLAQDRPDIAFAAKEVCREMAKPTAGSWRRAKRLVRYLARRPRMVSFFDFQDDLRELVVFADANWAGCKTSRKSTSGGCVMRGAHLLRFWSKTQASIAQSSAESELFGAVRGGVEGLGAQTLLQDLGMNCSVSLVLDASAALGILQRKGVGKIRHLDVGTLWLQEKEAQRRITLGRVKGENNPADLGTKHLTEETMLKHTRTMNQHFVDGRAGAASKLLKSLALARAPRLPLLWTGEIPPAVWQKKNGGTVWTRVYRGARALRGAEEELGPGLSWNKVVRYKAVDTATGETLEDCDVTKVAANEPRLHRRLPRPVDLTVELEVCANAASKETASEEGSSEDPRASTSTEPRGGAAGEGRGVRASEFLQQVQTEASDVSWEDRVLRGNPPFLKLLKLQSESHSGLRFGSSNCGC